MVQAANSPAMRNASIGLVEVDAVSMSDVMGRGVFVCRLTFELSGDRRLGATARLGKIGAKPQPSLDGVPSRWASA